MQQEPDSSYLYKPASEPMTAEACRQEVRKIASRGPIAPVGLLGWYRVPTVGNWIGCFPEDYDPYERRN